MNPIAFTPTPQFSQNITSTNGTEVSKCPEEFLNEGEYMFYDVLDDEEGGDLEQQKHFSRKEIIENDLKKLNFKEFKSPHFDLLYTQGSDAEEYIEDIANKREYARTKLCSFFPIAPDDARHKIYIFENDIQSYCPTWGKTFASRAIPEDLIAGILFMSDPKSYENNNYGHELTHLFEFFFLPFMMRVPPYLREGMADYMSMDSCSRHLKFIKFLKAGLVPQPFVMTEDKLNNPEYMESSSFIEYIAEVFGTGKLLDFYVASAVLQKGENIKIEQFSEIVRKSLDISLEDIMTGFYNYICSLWNCENVSVPKERLSDVINILNKSSEFVKTEDVYGISSLYSDDFYFRTKDQLKNLFTDHMLAMDGLTPLEYNLYPLDSWLYGESFACKVLFDKLGIKLNRTFVFEKLYGTWRISPKYVGGIEC